MDLKVWFPLNGNYLSYGLQTYSDITYNGTLDSTGKTGSCYAFASKYFRINGSMINGLDEFTVACWVYLTSTTYNIFTFKTSNAYWQFALNNNYLRVRDTVTGATGTRKDLAITAIPQTTWTHVTVTYNKGSIKVYQDGVLKDTLTGNANASIVSTTTVLCIGADPVNSTSTYPGNCKVNDFRVYEHALSQKEIKELARGLIIHYPLCTRESVLSKYSSVNWNQLIPNGDFSNGTTNWGIHDSSIEIISVSNGELTLTKVGGSYGGMCRVNPFTADSTHVYYLKATLKTNSDGIQAFFGFCTSSWTVGSNTQYNTTSLNYETISFTASPAANSAYLILRTGVGSSSAGVSLTCKNFMCIDLTAMFGDGNEPSKEMCDLIFVDNYYTYDAGSTKSLVSPIYDESGYRRNATVTNSTLSLSDDSRRYDVSSVFNGAAYLQVASPTTEARSVSFWVKWPSTVQDKTVCFVDYKSRLAFGFGASGSICSAIIGTKQFPKNMFTAGNWYHIVVVNDGTSLDSTTRKLYVNGIEISPTTTDNYWTHNVDYLQVGARSYNLTTYPPLNGLMSDFRMYAKALTQEDVTDLYENSVNVDNFGNAYCYEVQEEAENLFTFENLQEDSNAISITTTNEEKAIMIPENAFQSNSNKFLEGRFKPNTQYKFDMWLDGYGSSAVVGIRVYYTNESYNSNELFDIQYTIQGYKHRIFYSPSGVSIDHLELINPSFSNSAICCRTDSVIIPMNNPTNIERTGVVDTGCFREDTTEVSIGKGDIIDVNNLIEK